MYINSSTDRIIKNKNLGISQDNQVDKELIETSYDSPNSTHPNIFSIAATVSKKIEEKQPETLVEPQIVKMSKEAKDIGIDPHWVHGIIEKDPLYWRSNFTFEDGTIWTISGVENWNPGDQILITYDPEGGVDQWDYDFKYYYRSSTWEFFNITQNQTARGDCWDTNRNAKNIVKVSAFTNYYNTVLLSNGLILNFEKNKDALPIFVNWKKDDIVMTISKKGNSNQHCLWNLRTGDKVCDLQIQ